MSYIFRGQVALMAEELCGLALEVRRRSPEFFRASATEAQASASNCP
jgi:hypothetical protein